MNVDKIKVGDIAIALFDTTFLFFGGINEKAGHRTVITEETIEYYRLMSDQYIFQHKIEHKGE